MYYLVTTRHSTLLLVQGVIGQLSLSILFSQLGMAQSQWQPCACSAMLRQQQYGVPSSSNTCALKLCPCIVIEYYTARNRQSQPV